MLGAFGAERQRLPVKSSLAKARKKVSWKFFKERFDELVDKVDPHRRRWKGLLVYAIDGQQLTLPRTADVVVAGYNGRAVSKHRESYLPRAYMTHAYDVLNSVSKDLRFTPRLNEQADAKAMIANFEKDSITLYDRLYFSRSQVLAHFAAGNFFLMRCRKNASAEIIALLKNSKRRSKMIVDGHVVYLIKVRNPKTDDDDIFATNLPPNLVAALKIRELYRLRWGVETSFAELTATCKLQQWHSRFCNGILQELYALFWLVNYTKAALLLENAEKRRSPLSRRYRKANFKLVFNYIASVMPKILQRPSLFISRIRELIRVSTQSRLARSRAYPRQKRGPASPYPVMREVK